MSSELVLDRDTFAEDAISSLSSSLVSELQLAVLMEATLETIVSEPLLSFDAPAARLVSFEGSPFIPAARLLSVEPTTDDPIAQGEIVSASYQESEIGSRDYSSLPNPSASVDAVWAFGSGFDPLHSNMPHASSLDVNAPWRSRVELSMRNTASPLDHTEVNESLINLFADYTAQLFPSSPAPYTIPLPEPMGIILSTVSVPSSCSPTQGPIDASLIGHNGSALSRHDLQVEGSEQTTHVTAQAQGRSDRDEFSPAPGTSSTPRCPTSDDMGLCGAQAISSSHAPGGRLFPHAHLPERLVEQAHDTLESLGALVPNLWPDLSPLLDMEHLLQFPFPILDWDKESTPSFLTLTSRSASFTGSSAVPTDQTPATAIAPDLADINLAQQVGGVNAIGYIAQRLFRALTVLVCW